MRTKAGRLYVSWVVSFLLVLGTTVSGGPAKKAPAKKTRAVTPVQVPIIPFDFYQMALPDTSKLPLTLTPPRDNIYVWDQFAWQSFIAMNWPALEPTVENGFVRGWPDARDPANVNFPCAGDHLGPLVWETFKEKREVFNEGARTEEEAKPNPWSYPFDYPVDGADGEGKILTKGINFVSLDETVEVGSQAREVGALVPDAQSKAFTPVFPRVYRGLPPAPPPALQFPEPGNEVRYEVKVNYDFFKYVVDNKLYYDENTYARSLQNPPVQLPWRTTAVKPGVKFYTQKPAKTNYVSGYSAEKTQRTYQIGPLQRGQTPPEIGAVHIKAAWVPIADKEKDRFLHRTSTYFVFDGKTGKYIAREATFGLVGLHIIQRIKATPVIDNTANANPTPLLNNAALGGTFIYATWEHVEFDPPDGRVGKQNYFYDNLYFDATGKKVEYDRHGPYPVTRLYKILDHTQQADWSFWNQIKDVKCPSGKPPVWLNYRLVGVQYMPVDIKENPTDAELDHDGLDDPGAASGLPHYLANVFVETNKGLQHFQGLPPLTTPANQFTGLEPYNVQPPPAIPPFYAGNVAGTFDHKGQNLAYSGNRYNMGGCMGCHGVAQLKGYSFSFVLLGGQQGAGVDAESRFDAPPPAVRPDRYLLSGGVVTIQNQYKAEVAAKYVASDAAERAVYQTAQNLFTIVGVSTPPGERLRFGDSVYLLERASSLYLTATDRSVGTDIKAVTFTGFSSDQRVPDPAAVWVLYDAADPDSTKEIKKLTGLSFKNDKITFGADGAYLTILGPDAAKNVNVTNHASPVPPDTLEQWTLTRIR